MKSFIPFIVIGICIAMYYMYMAPTYADITALSTTKSDYATALSNIALLKSHRDAILAQYSAIDPSDIDKLQKIIPDTSDNVDVVSNINAIAAQYGMTIRQVKITEPQTESRTAVDSSAPTVPYQTSTISFSVTGQYPQFTMFLHDLESNIRLFDVTGLSIASDQKTAGGQLFDYTITVNAYSLH
jgi:Tfp pilus assembly protein PilO